MHTVRRKIPERASAYVNMKTVLGRIEKRGQFEKLLSFVAEIKNAEEKELFTELAEDTQNIGKYSNVFKENLKVLLNILGMLYDIMSS